MIPKKIHYCWLSDDPMPEKLLKCVESWKKYLPDYELVKWDLKKFPLSKNPWVREAFENKSMLLLLTTFVFMLWQQRVEYILIVM